MKNIKWIRFFKVSPGGNTTIFLDQSQVKPEARAGLAARLMDSLSLGGEQVGFIDWPGKKRRSEEGLPSIRMMGGEFCANATRAYAALLAVQNPDSLPWRGKIESSGLNAPVNAYVMQGEDQLDASIEVPLGNDWSITSLDGAADGELSLEQGAIVRLPGITHIILPDIHENEEPFHKPDKDLLLSAANWRRKLGLEEEAAAGCIWFDLKKDSLSMLPLVWVRETNTCCLETSCGSGALALALFLGKAGGNAGISVPRDSIAQGVHSPPFTSYTHFYWIRQPSGEAIWISYTLQKDSAGSFLPGNVWLGGPFRIIARGETL